MTALAQEKDALIDAEKEMLARILELFEDNVDTDDYCTGCEAITPEPDIGCCSCPCDFDPFDRNCINGNLSSDLDFIEQEAKNFLLSIRGYW